jgi:hypothetical protein
MKPPQALGGRMAARESCGAFPTKRSADVDDSYLGLDLQCPGNRPSTLRTSRHAIESCAASGHSLASPYPC